MGSDFASVRSGFASVSLWAKAAPVAKSPLSAQLCEPGLLSLTKLSV
jgi:hypothetical protein